MGSNRFFDDLETLDISLLLDSLREFDQYHFVFKLLEEAHFWVWKHHDLFSDFYQGGDDNAEAIEWYNNYDEEMDSLILVLLDVFGSAVRSLRQNYSEEGRIIDIKVLMDLPSSDRIKIINICLEYVDKAIKVDDKLEELRTTLIAIRDEDLKIIEEDKPF